MLQLKKQQLQGEIQAIDNNMAKIAAREKELRGTLGTWSQLLAEPVDLDQYIAMDRIETDEGNIAGVSIPVFKSAVINTHTPDLFNTPTWIDDAMDLLKDLIAVNAEREILQEQRRLIEEELRTTSQRVNLFEKVKIPECKEHIRVIRIFLGDEQTASVARAKLAKSRSLDYAYKDELA